MHGVVDNDDVPARAIEPEYESVVSRAPSLPQLIAAESPTRSRKDRGQRPEPGAPIEHRREVR